MQKVPSEMRTGAQLVGVSYSDVQSDVYGNFEVKNVLRKHLNIRSSRADIPMYVS